MFSFGINVGAKRNENIIFKAHIMHRKTNTAGIQLVNPAVAKSIMSRMNGKQLLTEIAFYEKELHDLKPGNLRSMYLNLRNYAQSRLKSLNAKSDNYELDF